MAIATYAFENGDEIPPDLAAVIRQLNKQVGLAMAREPAPYPINLPPGRVPDGADPDPISLIVMMGSTALRNA